MMLMLCHVFLVWRLCWAGWLFADRDGSILLVAGCFDVVDGVIGSALCDETLVRTDGRTASKTPLSIILFVVTSTLPVRRRAYRMLSLLANYIPQPGKKSHVRERYTVRACTTHRGISRNMADTVSN